MGVLGYLVFPWYAQQDANGLLAVGQVFSSEQAANGLMQAALFGRPWLWLGLAGLVVAGLGACLPAGRKQVPCWWRGCTGAGGPAAQRLCDWRARLGV